MKIKMTWMKWALISSIFVNIGMAAEVMPGEYVVKLKMGEFGALSGIGSENNLANLSKRLGAPISRVSKDFSVVLVKKNGDSSKTLASLSHSSLVAKVEPNYIYRAMSSDLSWNMENHGQKDCGGRSGIAGVDVSGELANKVTKGSRDIIVAVIDTGVDLEHPALKDSLLKGDARNFFDKTATAQDGNGHGTFCAGVIAAKDAGEPVHGLAQDVSVLPLKFLSDEGAGSLMDAVDAINYAVAKGAKVLSNSWGGGGESEILKSAIAEAGKKGVLFVAAAGNDGTDMDQKPVYPAGYKLDNIIVVAPVTNLGTLPFYSNFGKTSVHLAAPGENVYGLTTGGGYTCLSGSSMSTPHVAAAAALILAKYPTISLAELKNRLIRTSKPLDGLKDKMVGGMLDAARALE